MDPSKVTTIIEWSKLKNFRDVQVFIGFVNFYRRFILRFSKIVKPITDLLQVMIKRRKIGLFYWIQKAQRAFIWLKEFFTTALILRLFDPTLKIRLETDVSGYALGAIIS